MSSNGSEEGVKDIFERDRSGERVSMSDPEFHRIYDVIHDTMAKLQRMNTSVMTQEEVDRVFADVTGTEYDETLTLFPPFYMDFGKNLRVGRNVLIQQCCTFMDRCGITMGDNTFIAPRSISSRSTTRWSRPSATAPTGRRSPSAGTSGSASRPPCCRGSP